MKLIPRWRMVMHMIMRAALHTVTLCALALAAAFLLVLYGSRLISYARSQVSVPRSDEYAGYGMSVLAGLIVLAVLVVVARYVLARPSGPDSPALPVLPRPDPAAGAAPAATAERSGPEAGEALRPPGPAATAAPASSGESGLKPPVVRVLMVGYGGAGKTHLLAGLYRSMKSGPDGIRLEPNAKTRSHLDGLIVQIQDTRPDAPMLVGTGSPEEEWCFSVVAGHGGQRAVALTLVYWDYEGGKSRDEGNNLLLPQFGHALHEADILMGLLDGAEVAKVMAGSASAEAREQIRQVIAVLAEATKRSVHLVISKWDLLSDSRRGRRYTLDQVLTHLDTEFPELDELRHISRRGMRTIKVAALGTNGFVHPGPGKTMIKSGDVWDPKWVTDPLFCALPDIIDNDLDKIGESSGKAADDLTFLTKAVLTIARAVEVNVSVRVLGVEVSPSQQVRDQMKAKIASWKGAGGRDAPGAEEAFGTAQALRHVLRCSDQVIARLDDPRRRHA